MDNIECIDHQKSPVICFDKHLGAFILPYSENYRVARCEENVYIISKQFATHHKYAKTIDLWKAYWYAFKRAKKHILNILYFELKKRNAF